MSGKLYGVDQFYPGDFVSTLTGVYTDIFPDFCDLMFIESKTDLVILEK
ncbi:MAG: hypothetical protein M1327_04385 [Candidatus Thermoplasmatota archaeon]|nr:hypothetical protein [Candidatus Thermoplasmatota archaeon]